MKKVLLVNVAIIMLLIPACRGSKSSETDAPAAAKETQVKSIEVLI